MSSSASFGDCSVCYSALKQDDTFVIVTCGHAFHGECIKTWLTYADNCPTCRSIAYEHDVIKIFFSHASDDNVSVEVLPVGEEERDKLIEALLEQVQEEFDAIVNS